MAAPNCYKCDNPRRPKQRSCKSCANKDSLASYHRNREKHLSKWAHDKKNRPKGRRIFERMQLIFDVLESNIDDCILWPYTKNTHKYGIIFWDYQPYTVSRLVLELSLGRELKKGMETLHSCHNRACYNTNHLREGTHEENMQDMAIKISSRKIRNKVI